MRSGLQYKNHGNKPNVATLIRVYAANLRRGAKFVFFCIYYDMKKRCIAENISFTVDDSVRAAREHPLPLFLVFAGFLVGVLLGAIECGKETSAVFLRIYGKNWYLVAIRSLSIGKVLQTEAAAILLISLTILSLRLHSACVILPIFFGGFVGFLGAVTVGFLFTVGPVCCVMVGVLVFVPVLAGKCALLCFFSAAAPHFQRKCCGAGEWLQFLLLLLCAALVLWLAEAILLFLLCNLL